ncbi:hypothetical protein PSJE_00115 [Pseudomonas jessenii]|uniref:YobI-like P-loop NTPase domain-containing protein n=1 Tax=Pseudomonas jessenii TaxID=77298 RepID=A0A231GQ23_PSEJE|nr:hypothetical protein [Pseudomonas jessenii]OXR38672.1 hypothetical protein PSJE_00115 [Pseudomonas jessenii]SEC49412.1 hypothetical protein SAMN04490187_4585 [Pseudomonas jessenii]
MLSRITVFFRSKYESVSAGIHRVIGQCKRYWTALVKAVQAARDFLAVPGSTNVFEPLTPVLLEPRLSHRYESELLSALRNDQVRNIAITGEYGAGKSSVIRTFVERHPELEFAFISLAAFGKDLDKNADSKMRLVDAAGSASIPIASDPKNSEKKVDSDLLTRIEETIVQQLLYAVPSEKLPKTRLKRIIQASLPVIWFRTIFFILLIVGALRLYFPAAEKPPKFVPDWLLAWLSMIPDWLAVIVLVGGGLYMMFNGLKLISLFSIDGFTIKGGKLETTHHGSVLHKNVDEIIYCFERSKIDVVVIEDLDRFGIHDVFTRLREINFIIKQSPQIKRRIYFLYALRDELFAVGEKTKFFDLIIPIIPVVNSENSREKLLELLRERQFNGAELCAGLDYPLLETVCYFIDDMRLIKNIVNEFDMFSTILGAGSGLKLDPNKLFSIIAIRNLHPSEYAHLVKRRGAIYETIHGFGEWRIRQSKHLENAYQALHEERERRVQELANSTAELRAYVWLELLKRSGVSGATHIQLPSGTQFTLNDFVSDNVFEAIFAQNTSLTMGAIDRYGQFNHPSAAVGSKELLASTSYEKRYELLQRTLVDIDHEMAERRIESSRINHQTFRSAARKSYGEVIIEKLNGLDVVIYLMRHGYFDTDYTDYFGYFYAGSLTSEDKNLILGLRGGVSPDVATVISAPKMVAEKLDTDDLSDGRGTIVALIDYLASCPYNEPSMKHERNKLETILRSGLEIHRDRMAEATEILISGPNSTRFVQAVHAIEPGLFRALLVKDDRFESVVSKQTLICAIMDGLEVAQIRQLDLQPHTQIHDAIKELEDVSRLMPGLEVDEKGWSCLRERPIRFSNLGDAIHLDDLKKLIKWRCVELNLHTLSLICRKAQAPYAEKVEATYLDKSDHGANLVTYRRLKALEIEGLDEQLLQMPEDLADTLLAQVGVLEESAESLSTLLWAIHQTSESESESDTLDQLFDRAVCSFEYLEGVPQPLWTKVLSADRVSKKSEAVWTFFDKVLLANSDENGCEQKDMDAFASYIQKHAQQLHKDLWAIEDSLHQDLQKYLLASTGVDNETLQELFAGLVLNDPAILDGSFGLLPKERWEMLASSTFLAFTPEIRQSIQGYNPDLDVPFLVAHWEQAREQIDFSQLPIDMVLKLSKSRAPTLDEKINLWVGLSAEAFDACKEAAEEIAKVCALANRHTSSFPLSFVPLLRKLAALDGLSTDQRGEMLIQCLPASSWGETQYLLGLLRDEGFKRLVPTVRRIEVPNSDLNRRLLDALQIRGFVGTVTTKADVFNATTRPSEMKDLLAP